MSALKLSARPDARGPARRRPHASAGGHCPPASVRLSRRESTRVPRSLLPLTILTLAALITGCGKRKPPQPPVERVPQRTELLSGIQRGNRVLLSWPAPAQCPRRSVPSIRRLTCTAAEPTAAPEALTRGRSARARPRRLRALRAIQPPRARSLRRRAGADGAVRLRYALRYSTPPGARAFSNFLLVEPAATVSLPPALPPTRAQRDRRHTPLGGAALEHRRLHPAKPSGLQRLPRRALAGRVGADSS